MTNSKESKNVPSKSIFDFLLSQQDSKKTISLMTEDILDITQLKQRKLYLNAEVDDEIIDDIVDYILFFNSEDKGIPADQRQPIRLYMNTPGGSVSAGYALIDAIITSKTPVYTINQGVCFSMGFLIFISGHKRFAMPHSEFLMHDGQTAAWDSSAKVKDLMDFELNQVEPTTKIFILSHTKITPRQYTEKYRVEWYFLPEEAKKLGVTDMIVGKDCDMDDVV